MPEKGDGTHFQSIRIFEGYFMSEKSVLKSMDLTPREPRPLQMTQPDVLAVTAALAGLSPAPVTKCRVLELGCGVGGNLLPMAQGLPESTFFGIDPSASAIARAEKTAAGAGLKNIRFEARDLLGSPAEENSFDYIIAHGVYHPLNPTDREELLVMIARLLSPDGVAYVSYNIYPGWSGREMFRDMITRHVQGETDSKSIAAKAREFIGFLDRHAQTSSESVYASQIRRESSFLNTVPDDYLIHEYLESSPAAVYFEQFAGDLTRNGLAYVGEVRPNPSRRKLADDLRREQPGLTENWVTLEQSLDYVQGGFARRSLLCHAEKPVSRVPHTGVIERLHARCRILPAVKQANIRSNEPMPFQFPDGVVVNINDVFVKTILVALARAWPQTMSFDEMVRVIRVDLQYGENFAATGSDERVTLMNATDACYAATLIDLHEHPAVYVQTASEKPQASALARFQARESKTVTNVHHILILNLSKVDRLVLAHLNGARDRNALIAVLKAAIAKGILPDSAKDQQAAYEAGLNGSLEKVIEQSLSKLAADGFLLA